MSVQFTFLQWRELQIRQGQVASGARFGGSIYVNNASYFSELESEKCRACPVLGFLGSEPWQGVPRNPGRPGFLKWLEPVRPSLGQGLIPWWVHDELK